MEYLQQCIGDMQGTRATADRHAVRADVLVISVVLILMVPGVAANEPEQNSIAAMEASVKLQRASVRQQAGFDAEASFGFFYVPWPGSEAAAVGAASIDCDPIPEAQLDAYIQKIAQREGFTPDLLRAVIAKESAFHPCAVSTKGAQGLMQLMPGTAAELGVADPFDPEENIEAGARYLGELITRYDGDLTRALGAYNAGPAQVDTYNGLPPIPETMNYVSDILQKLQGTPSESRLPGSAER